MKVEKLIEEIIDGENKYFSYSHFAASNMSDYTLMSYTIQDLTSVYPIDVVEAVEIIEALTH